MSRNERNEVSYYPEIRDYIESQIKSNFKASCHREHYIFWEIGELKKGLRTIISANPEICACAESFAQNVPPLSLDIFALVTDGVKFEILILEVKIGKPVGLKEWSQLVGYCLVSGAKYGLLINIDQGGSPRLMDLLRNETHLSHIKTVKDTGNEHLLGFMTWDSDTRNFEYSLLGAVKSLSSLSEGLASEFGIN
ncbi:MAG: hypothetical protein LBM93_01375 [Oscillospiraceae bacterium]|jgi:hypothetical protein|nr:hypothetical protein [Oscillospiraceae bacterium]